MKKRDGYTLWLSYLDAKKRRSQGRRVPKSLAVSSLRLEELVEAAKNLRLKVLRQSRKAYPKAPHELTGFIVVRSEKSKSEVLKDIAREILEIRKKG